MPTSPSAESRRVTVSGCGSGLPAGHSLSVIDAGSRLSAEHPGFTWHTLGGHAYDAHPFWDTVGKGTTGGYRQAELCEHLEA